MNTPRKSEVSACFIVHGSLSDGSAFLTREFIWPSCDCPEHRRYIKSLMLQKAKRMNAQGAVVTVQYQELKDDLWQNCEEQNH